MRHAAPIHRTATSRSPRLLGGATVLAAGLLLPTLAVGPAQAQPDSTPPAPSDHASEQRIDGPGEATMGWSL